MDDIELVPSVREAALSLLVDSARAYMQASKAPATLRAYESDWKHFKAFCSSRGLAFLPAQPETVALYLAQLADTGLKPATLSRRMAAISKTHAMAGYASPTRLAHASVSEVWAGIRRRLGTRQNAKSAATVDYLKRMLEQLPNSLVGIRDRALLLVGFAAALRRSELVGLCVEDLAFVPEGLVILIRSSKTDQEGAGEKIGIHSGRVLATCPVRSLREWLAAAGVESGPIFRNVSRHGKIGRSLTPQVVALQVKRYAEAAGLDPHVFSGHSLRAGHATSAARSGAQERDIQNQTRHKSVAMLRRYIREADLFRSNSSGQIGL